MANTPNLDIPLWSEGQDLPNVTHNEALLIIDILLQGRVLDRDLTAPPGLPAEGDAYIVASVASGDWLSHEEDIAYFFGGIWNFITPKEGWEIFVADEAIKVIFDGSIWVFGVAGSGNTLLMARFNGAGSILLQVSSVGAVVSVGHPSLGIYDMTFTGISASNVLIIAQFNDQAGGARAAYLRGVTNKSSSTGPGTPSGCRVTMTDLFHSSCGGCPFMEASFTDFPFSLEVKEMN